MKTTRWTLLLALLGTVSYGAEVYRSTDPNGVPAFSDRPGENSETVFIATPRPGRAATSPTQRPSAAQQTAANAARPAAAAAPGDPAAQTEAERAAERVKNCGLARERTAQYETARRLYRTTPEGEREYLTDGEIDEAKARAAADVATWCG